MPFGGVDRALNQARPSLPQGELYQLKDDT